MENNIKKINKFYNSNTNELFISILLVISVTLSSYAINPILEISKETQVIYVFDNKTKKLTNILLYDAVLGKKGAAFIEKFENSSFFTGFFKGEFKEDNGEILPMNESMFVILRDTSSIQKQPGAPTFLKKNQYPGSDVFFPVKEFIPGDMFLVLFSSFKSQTKVEVLKNDKKETVLKVL